MTTNDQSTKSNLPQYHAFHVTDAAGEGQKARWHRIGAVFGHEDGEGGTLILDSLPIGFDGRIVLRAPKVTSPSDA